MPVNDIRKVKADLRSLYKKKRMQLPEKIKNSMDSSILNRVTALKQYKSSKQVFTYVSKDIEVDTIEFIKKALKDGKKVGVPRCITDKRLMEFYYIESLSQLESGAFGVLEPDPSKCRSVTDFSNGFCIVPGLSFDSDGFRLGYGKGYYDRFLARFGGITVGLCYCNCMRWKLPHGYFDKPVNFVITEKYFRKIHS